jgi:hypothetical protein
MWFRPRRTLVAEAIHLAHVSEKGRGIVIIDYENPVNSVCIDTALLIIKKTQHLREKDERRRRADRSGERENLRHLVAHAAGATGLDSGRRYAYELVLMRYYGLIKQYQERIRKLRGLPPKQRSSLGKASSLPTLALTG